VEPFVCVSPP
jgi:hypothetical protein